PPLPSVTLPLLLCRRTTGATDLLSSSGCEPGLGEAGLPHRAAGLLRKQVDVSRVHADADRRADALGVATRLVAGGQDADQRIPEFDVEDDPRPEHLDREDRPPDDAVAGLAGRDEPQLLGA